MADLDTALENSTETTNQPEYFVEVNYENKTFNVPSYYRVAGVRGDRESRKIWFRLKQFPDEMKMLESAIEIIYINAVNEAGRYVVLDVKADGDDVIFSFTIPYNLSAYAGSISLALCAHTDNQEWHTSPVNLSIAQFPDVEIIEPTDPKYDIINQVLVSIVALSNEIGDDTERIEALENQIEMKFDAVEKVDNDLYFYSNGTIVQGPIEVGTGTGTGGGGGGSSSGNNAVLTVRNAGGWTSKTIAENSSCTFTLQWSSLEDDLPTGNGNAKLTCNGSVVADLDIEQGIVEIDLVPYLAIGTNSLRISVTDIYGNTKTLMFSVKVVALSISSTFDDSSPVTGDIYFPYTANGAVEKTVHFVLDGSEIGTEVITTSGRQSTYYIPAQTHGSHTLQVYFTATVEGNAVTSNILYYDIIWTAEDSLDVIITSSFSDTEANQYENIIIPYSVYDPSSLTAPVSYYANGELLTTLTVDRTKQYWTYKAMETGSLILKIVSGDAEKTITMTIKPVSLVAQAETKDLVLYLSSYGRSNNESDPEVWTFESIDSDFDDFNLVTDGWAKDEDGISVLRVAGDSRLTINYTPAASDWKVTGKTIEFEFATRDVRDMDATIISCMSGGRGFSISAQKAMLKSAQSEISMQYNDDTHVRVSFVIEKRNENRLMYLYVDGVMCGAVPYPLTDDFEQISPVYITVGHEDCSVDLYAIRIYDNNLNRVQIKDNFVVDTQDGQLLVERDTRNDVYDEYGQISINKLPKDLPYFVFETDVLPQYKGDKKTIAGYYVNPVDSSKSFSWTAALLNVQGTSSQYYYVKNWKITFSDGIIMESGVKDSYALLDDVIATNEFCLKADVASSESANNVIAAQFFNDLDPFKTGAQVSDSRVRQSITGFPVVIFQKVGSTYTFMGKYNFNLDKGTPEPFGFTEGDESWELCNNTSDRVIFKSDDFDSVDDKGEYLWKSDFEARYPDKNTDITWLKRVCTWIKSTDGNTTKFKNELSNYFDVNNCLWYYLWTFIIGDVDGRAKNCFMCYDHIKQTGYWILYDGDTILGINNEGQLVFDYNIEDTDMLSDTAAVWNGKDSVFWNNIRVAYADEIQQMYYNLRSQNKLSAQILIDAFNEHQSKWPEAVFNEDMYHKYIEPLVKSNDSSYLTMLQGSKKSQREWWLTNRFKYLDSKWQAGDNQSEVITLRGYAKNNLVVTPYIDMYVNVKYGSYMTSTRGTRNTAYTMTCPLDAVNDTEIYVYGASNVAELTGIDGLKVGYINISAATKLRNLKVGDADSNYSNPNLTEIGLGNNTLLKTIDARNCGNLGKGTSGIIDVSGCSAIENLYFEGTSITGVNLPDGGILKVLHLPSTTTTLILKNQNKITDLSITADYELTTLVLENVEGSNIDCDDLISELPNNSRLRYVGFYKEVNTIAEIDAYMDTWDKHRGLDEAGNTMSQAQISGTFHIAEADGDDLARLKERYPYVTVEADHTTATITYVLPSTTVTRTVLDGGDDDFVPTSSQSAKSSTAQYTYTFAGWSKTDGGAKWSDAQKNVTASRTVYAYYTASVRYYNVYIYTKGGTANYSKVSTQSVAYGGYASYDASSDMDENSQPFQYFSPALGPISGETSCYAQYKSPVERVEITDSWDTIFTNISNGTYKTKYMVGNYKDIALTDGKTFTAQIYAIDGDDLADNSSKAPITWGPDANSLWPTYHRWNPSLASTTDEDQNTVYTEGTGTIGGWDKCELKTWIANNVLPKFPENIREHMAQVTKTQPAYNTSGSQFTQTSTELMFIPSYAEIFDSGGLYHTLHDTANNRKKKRIGESSYAWWWLRTAYSATSARGVGSGGDGDYSGVSSASGAVAPCFSTI